MSTGGERGRGGERRGERGEGERGEGGGERGREGERGRGGERGEEGERQGRMQWGGGGDGNTNKEDHCNTILPAEEVMVCVCVGVCRIAAANRLTIR